MPQALSTAPDHVTARYERRLATAFKREMDQENAIRNELESTHYPRIAAAFLISESAARLVADEVHDLYPDYAHEVWEFTNALSLSAEMEARFTAELLAGFEVSFPTGQNVWHEWAERYPDYEDRLMRLYTEGEAKRAEVVRSRGDAAIRREIRHHFESALSEEENVIDSVILEMETAYPEYAELIVQFGKEYEAIYTATAA